MWPRWNTRSIFVQGLPALPAEVVPGPPVANNAPLIRARDAVSPPTRGRSAVSDATAAELLWVHLHSVTADVVSPRGRSPPAHQAPSEATLVRHAVHREQSSSNSASGGVDSPHCFRTLAGPSKQMPAGGADGEASGPSEFKKAYASDESRRRLLWEQEVPSSSLGAPTSWSANGQF
jgi:hypothetical protein